MVQAEVVVLKPNATQSSAPRHPLVQAVIFCVDVTCLMSINEAFSWPCTLQWRTGFGLELATQEQVVEVCACAMPMASMAAANITKGIKKEIYWQ